MQPPQITAAEAALQDALLQEAARRITWSVGQVINIGTEEGLEEATILGPSSEGDATQMRVRFADGTVDNWDIEDFVAADADAAVPDTVATGKAAAIALQQEIVKHGTGDVEKIKRLRRASMRPHRPWQAPGLHSAGRFPRFLPLAYGRRFGVLSASLFSFFGTRSKVTDRRIINVNP